MEAALGILSGFVSGVMSGAFGVGGAILTTPAVRVLLSAPPLVAVGTPLPAILPTSLTGVHAYWRAGHLDARAVGWLAPPGMLGAAAGALLTKVVNAHALLLATAALIAWQAIRVGGWRAAAEEQPSKSVLPSSMALALTGLVAGFASGLLGIGGGVVLVPVLAGLMKLPLKRALGTSLAVIAAMVLPGTAVHAALGHIDWTIFFWLSIGVVPGAAIGSRWAIGAQERLLRRVVGSFLLLVAVAYGALEVHDLLR